MQQHINNRLPRSFLHCFFISYELWRIFLCPLFCILSRKAHNERICGEYRIEKPCFYAPCSGQIIRILQGAQDRALNQINNERTDAWCDQAMSKVQQSFLKNLTSRCPFGQFSQTQLSKGSFVCDEGNIRMQLDNGSRYRWGNRSVQCLIKDFCLVFSVDDH